MTYGLLAAGFLAIAVVVFAGAARQCAAIVVPLVARWGRPCRDRGVSCSSS